jgi:hypothetical protein
VARSDRPAGSAAKRIALARFLLALLGVLLVLSSFLPLVSSPFTSLGKTWSAPGLAVRALQPGRYKVLVVLPPSQPTLAASRFRSTPVIVTATTGQPVSYVPERAGVTEKRNSNLVIGEFVVVTAGDYTIDVRSDYSRDVRIDRAQLGMSWVRLLIGLTLVLLAIAHGVLSALRGPIECRTCESEGSGPYRGSRDAFNPDVPK